MTCIHNDEVNKISECNLLHNIINPPKRTNFFNRYYSPILHGCMNTKHGKAKLNNFLILLESGCSSTILTGRLVKIYIYPEKYFVMQW